jgi:deoxyxylulose-5-phosphate synthase
MPDHQPETSTVRSALATLAAVEDCLDDTAPREQRIAAITTALREARGLRQHQLDDLVGHLLRDVPIPETPEAPPELFDQVDQLRDRVRG